MLDWDRPILCLVVDRATCVLPPAEAVLEAVRGGVDWVQIRERELTSGELLAWSESLAQAASQGARDSGHRVAVIVNRRVDIALVLGEQAQGVHLGFDAVSPAVARKQLGAASWIGVSTHSADEVAALSGSRAGPRASSPANEANYAHLAPIFAPLSKETSRPPLGLAALEQASRHGLPLLAQGGMDAQNARAAIDAGACGIAVTGTILQSSEPRAVAENLRRALDGGDPTVIRQ